MKKIVALLITVAGCGDTVASAIDRPEDAGMADTVDLAQTAITTEIRALDVHSSGTACAAGRAAFFVRDPTATVWQTVPLNSTDQSSLTNVRFFGVRCLSADVIVAVGSTDTSPPAARVAVLSRATPWTLALQEPLAEGDLFALASSKTKELMAVGYKLGAGGTADTAVSVALKSTDPVGGVWKEDSHLADWMPLRGFAVDVSGERAAVGDSGTLLFAPGDAQPYSREVNPRGPVALRALWSVGTTFIAAGDDNTLLSRGASGTWQTMPTSLASSPNWQAVDGSAPDDIFVVGGATVAHFDGSVWSEVTTISGLPSTRDLRAVRVDTTVSPTRVHLSGDRLLATCTVGRGAPPSLTCAP